MHQACTARMREEVEESFMKRILIVVLGIIVSFDAISERLRNVCIENLGYDECIRRYDSEDTLFYSDPPYLNSEHYYGKG